MSRASATPPPVSPVGLIKQLPAHAAARRRILSLGPKASMGVLASILISLLGSSSAPTPLYAIYQQHWGFSPITVTVVFGVYAVAVLSSLLIFGRISDQVGRRPVLVAALIVQALAMVVFITAGGVGALLTARVLQGLSAGAAVGALGAGMLDIDVRKGGFLNSFTPMLGTASGVFAAGLIVQYLPAPTRLVYMVLLGVFVLQALAVLPLNETVSRKPGALARMVPEFKLPRSARASVAIAAPVMFAVWALNGLYGALGPALTRTLVHSTSVVWGGLPVFVFTGSAGLAVVMLRNAGTRTMMLISIATLIVGVVITVLSIASGSGRHTVCDRVLRGRRDIRRRFWQRVPGRYQAGPTASRAARTSWRPFPPVRRVLCRPGCSGGDCRCAGRARRWPGSDVQGVRHRRHRAGPRGPDGTCAQRSSC
ncbi:MFS transporter [Streptomyces sp. NBC_01643]|uniref:MFS transporter n=1 Tax=Streptomyces sp. NBC_01643 TaxID=2975906 RepID=UPI0038688BC4|nr:MFS transporter [Streptomyces sp. NBC_01643]